MSGRKRLAYGTRKIGVVPAETLGQVKRKRKSQLCDGHHRFENGARFEGSCVLQLLPGGRPLGSNRKRKMAPQARDEAASLNLSSNLYHSPIYDFGAESQFRWTSFRVSTSDCGQTMGSCGPWTLMRLIEAGLGGNGDNDLSVSTFVRDCSTVRGRSLVQRNGGLDECSKMSSVKLLSDFN
jgi:hypothetical protein